MVKKAKVKGVLHTLPEISMFCALFQYHQHLLKNNLCILKQIVQGTQK